MALLSEAEQVFESIPIDSDSAQQIQNELTCAQIDDDVQNKLMYAQLFNSAVSMFLTLDIAVMLSSYPLRVEWEAPSSVSWRCISLSIHIQGVRKKEKKEGERERAERAGSREQRAESRLRREKRGKRAERGEEREEREERGDSR